MIGKKGMRKGELPPSSPDEILTVVIMKVAIMLKMTMAMAMVMLMVTRFYQ